MDIQDMINPIDVTHFDRSTAELEEFLLFCVVVAGKTAATQAKLLHKLLYEYVVVLNKEEKLYAAHIPGDIDQLNSFYDGRFTEDTPFSRIRFLIQRGILKDFIKASKLGQYNKIERAFQELVESDLDLRSCSIEQLEAIHGIGFKTSRFFVVHTRKNQSHAILDTHILKYMRDEMGISDVPKSTPGNRKEYAKLESLFVQHCAEAKRNVAELDLEIWTKYSRSAPPLVTSEV